MEYGCIAERLGHSFSLEIHAQLGSYRYELCEVAKEELDAFMTARAFRGINVTIPYKEAVIPYLYFTDDTAKEIGAVNTVVNRNGRLYGYNTDLYGMSALIRHIGLDLGGKKVAVLGTGGTSKTARAVAKALGAREILCVSRTAREGVIDYAQLASDHADTEILINTTPCGMFPHLDTVAVDIRAFPKLCGVVDAVYNPLRPQLVLDAKAHGIAAEGGLFMLVAQAVRASEIFLDCTYPEGTAERVYAHLLAQKENTVLIGMPGSGKTTVGRLLAKMTGKEFCDMDEAIAEDTKLSPTELFAQVGEAGFRDIESRVLHEQLAAKTGVILSTGGGAILRDSNVTDLRRNGRLYFLDRPLEQLVPTSDRPLSSSTEALRKRFEERYHRYCAVSDVHIKVDGDAESVAQSIGKDHCGKI